MHINNLPAFYKDVPLDGARVSYPSLFFLPEDADKLTPKRLTRSHASLQIIGIIHGEFLHYPFLYIHSLSVKI
jgi:hypothetical protein